MIQLTRSLLVIFFLFIPRLSYSQLRIGVTGGATLNHYTIDKQYMEDWHYGNEWGGTAGLSGQYEFLELRNWKFGVRADLNWMLKNHDEYRMNMLITTSSKGRPLNFTVINHYIQMPIMASITYGKRIRCDGNIGFYGAYWLSRIMNGYTPYGKMELKHFTSSTHNYDIGFNSTRDQRIEFGMVCGLGGEWQFKGHWLVQIQTLWFHGLTSTQKNYMKIKSPRYNDTLVLQAGLFYNF